MIPEVTLKDVQLAWKAFNDLGIPDCGSRLVHYRARETTWNEYTKIRDLYLYSIKRINLRELNRKNYAHVDMQVN